MPEPLSRRVYNGRSAAERAQARKQQLLDAALQIIGTEGFPATRINDICRAAGVSPRYFYESFRDSEDLLLQLYQREVDAMTAAVMGDLGDLGRWVGEPLTLVREALTRWFQVIEANPQAARIIFFEVHGISKQAEQVFLAGRKGFRDRVTMLVQLVLPVSPASHLDHRILAIGIVGALLELVRTWVQGELDLTVDQMVDRLLAVVEQFTGLGRDGAPPVGAR